MSHQWSLATIRPVPQPQQSVRVPSQSGIAKGRRVSYRVVSLRHSAYRVQRPAPRSCQQPPPILPASTSSRLTYRVGLALRTAIESYATSFSHVLFPYLFHIVISSRIPLTRPVASRQCPLFLEVQPRSAAASCLRLSTIGNPLLACSHVLATVSRVETIHPPPEHATPTLSTSPDTGCSRTRCPLRLPYPHKASET